MNVNRPGLPDYTGPKSGYFHAVHHQALFEYSNDIMERVKFYHDGGKPAHETPIRLHNLLYLPFVDAKRQSEYAAVYAKRQSEYDAVYAKRRSDRDAVYAPILAYIREQIPDSAWNGTELVFPKP